MLAHDGSGVLAHDGSGVLAHDPAALVRLDALARDSLERYGFARDATVKRIAVSENATYRLSDGRGRNLALRFYRAGARSDAAIRSEAAWMAALHEERVVRTAPPVAAGDGAVLQIFAGGQQAVAFAWVAGVEPPADATLPRRLHALGAIAARLHAHARRWTPPRDFERPRWDLDATIGQHAPWGDYRAAPGLDQRSRDVLARAAARCMAALATHGTDAERFGLIHADLRLANILADGDAITVIDFDDCGTGWFGFDFAASASFLEHEAFMPALQDAWCAGYRTVAPVPDERLLPVFVMLRRLQLTAWIGSHREADASRRLGGTFATGTVRLASVFMGR